MALSQAQTDAIEDAVADLATNPAEIHTDAGSIKEQPIPDAIQADRYAQSKAARVASASPLAGLRISKIGFGGTTGNA